MVIDRIENGYAVIENEGIMLDIPLSQLPDGVKEGDVLTFENGIYFRDELAAAEHREKISAKLENLFKRK